MEIKIRPHQGNSYPKTAVLIKGSSVEIWLKEIAFMELSMDQVQVFPIPGKQPNQLYGCLVHFSTDAKIKDIGRNNYWQLVAGKLFIPEHAIVSPTLTASEWLKLFPENKYIMHPEVGTVEFAAPIDWKQLLLIDEPVAAIIVTPSKGVFIPYTISSFQIEIDADTLAKQENPFSEQELIDNLPFDMKKILAGNQREMRKFLEFMKKHPELAMKYAIPVDLYNTGRGSSTAQLALFGRDWPRFFKLGKTRDSVNNFRPFVVIGFLVFIRAVVALLQIDNNNGFPFHQVVLLVLLFLVVLFLTMVFGNIGQMGDWIKSRNRGNGNGRSAVIETDLFNTLVQSYQKMAVDYYNKGEYQKSAHIYHKLLSQHLKAAQVLEEGKFWTEAAYMYLKQTQNKHKAAECFEKAHAYSEALPLYKELMDYEKTGDMNVLLSMDKEAEHHYRIVLDDYKKNHQYVSASLLCLNKLKNYDEGQQLLLEGWRNNKDAVNCMGSYFATIEDTDELLEKIEYIYKTEVNENNHYNFLQLLKEEYNKDEKLQQPVKNIAYEIIAHGIEKKPDLASELKFFNKDDKSIIKDIMKYKLKKRKGN